jgi:RNA recognition motif-containing protein
MDAEAKPRGFAHVEFREEEDVEFAVRELKGLKIRERIVRLDYADPEKSKREAKEGGGKTEGEAEGLRGQSDLDDERPTAATLYVGNLSYKAGVKEVTEFLERKAGKGSVKSVRLATDQATGRKKGFAYVDFFVEDDAKVCFEELHEKDLLGRSVRIDDATRR